MKVSYKDFQITARKDVLNELAIVFRDATKLNYNDGYNALADRYQNIANAIHQKLEDSGFFDKVQP